MKLEFICQCNTDRHALLKDIQLNNEKFPTAKLPGKSFCCKSISPRWYLVKKGIVHKFMGLAH